MDRGKTFQEKFGEIQTKLQSVLGGIITDIAQSDGGIERLRIMHKNHEMQTENLTLTESREISD